MSEKLAVGAGASDARAAQVTHAEILHAAEGFAAERFTHADTISAQMTREAFENGALWACGRAAVAPRETPGARNHIFARHHQLRRIPRRQRRGAEIVVQVFQQRSLAIEKFTLALRGVPKGAPPPDRETGK